MNALARIALTPTAWLYRGAVALRNAYYASPSAVRSAPVPVVSVGNLTLGGTGKTPLVSWIARRLQAIGRSPAVVSRGYGGTAGRGPVFVSRGAGPLCDAALAGDEPVELAAGLPGVRVVVGSDRRAGAAAAADDGADVVILDDGFQHRRLARDLDIVLLDASNPFDGGHLLPAGRLREPPHALDRAEFVLLTRARGANDVPQVEATIRGYAPRVTILQSDHDPQGFFDVHGEEVASPRRAVVFCGIGNPGRLRDDLEGLGIEVVAFRAFRDHHVYTRSELEDLRRVASSGEAKLVTTEKDLARIRAVGGGPANPAPIALRISVVIRSPGPLIEALERVTSTGAS